MRSLPMILLVGLLFGGSADAKPKKPAGTLGDNVVIHSEILDYDLQYRVYLPPGYETLQDLPVLYLTDGQWYIEPGRLPGVLNRMINRGKLDPLIAVFLDNRDPGNLEDNRRDRQFFCNRDFVRFVSTELTKEIDANFNTIADRRARTILGLSFGGLNSACFGLYGHESFRGIAMQSPAMHPIPRLLEIYERLERRDLKIFLSTGLNNDNEAGSRKLKKTLQSKGYELEYHEVPFGHNWNNWRPLLDDVLRFYYGRTDGD